MFLDGGERFSNSRSKPRRNLTECAQHIFFPRRLRLLVGEDVAGRAVCRAQAEDVLTAKRRDRSFQDGRAAGPDAHALRNVGSQSRIRRLVHQWQRSSDALLGDEAEERRLLKLHRQSLSQRIVEHRIAGRVGELGEHDRVLVGQLRLSRIEEVAHSGQGDCGGGSGNDCPTGACLRGRLIAARQRRVRSAFEALEISPQVGRVLITKIAIRLQALRDDALQLRRRLDAQPDGLRGPRALDHFVEHQAEAPDVGAVIHGLAAGLLRRHVGGGSHHDTLPRAGNRGHVRLRCGRPRILARPKSSTFTRSRESDEDVGGFDVAVDDARGMRGVQRVGDLDAHVEHRDRGSVHRRRAGPSASRPPDTPWR